MLKKYLRCVGLDMFVHTVHSMFVWKYEIAVFYMSSISVIPSKLEIRLSLQRDLTKGCLKLVYKLLEGVWSNLRHCWHFSHIGCQFFVLICFYTLDINVRSETVFTYWIQLEFVSEIVHTLYVKPLCRFVFSHVGGQYLLYILCSLLGGHLFIFFWFCI